MYRKEVNERSPMRVFESSMHGGLGRGNVGVVVARPGVGKSALLVQIALDDLMRERKVLHISHDESVDRVRSQYDEIFHDLAIVHELAHAQTVHVEVERNRLIYSHVRSGDEAPSSRGGSSSVSRIERSLSFASEVGGFKPDAIVIDGFDFDHASADAVAALKQLAVEHDAELWLTARTAERVSSPVAAGPSSTPTPLRRHFDKLDVIVLLLAERDAVHLQLLKEHDNPDVSELNLHLDPVTMLVIDEDLQPAAQRGRDPRQFHLYSGGARGAEETFGGCAERWGTGETHFSFDGHPFRVRERGVRVLSDDELRKGDFSLVYASHRLGRPLSQIPNIKRILQTAWHQISAANEVFIVGALQENGTVRGGTGWGAELARLWSKPVMVFDQTSEQWFRWDATKWVNETAPTIRRRAFAGIGTTKLTAAGRAAIEQLFARTFGPVG